MFSWKNAGVAIVAFVALVATWAIIFKPSGMEEDAGLLLVANLTFLTAASFFAAYLFGKAFLATGNSCLLWISVGLSFLGAGMLGTFFRGFPNGANISVTIANTGFLLFSAANLAGALASLNGAADFADKKKMFFAAFSGAVLVAAAVRFLVLVGVFPAFFDEKGVTPVRQLVLGSAIALLFASSAAFLKIYSKTKSGIAYWYALANVMLAVGFGVVFFAKAPGDALSWIGRICQWIGGIFVLASARSVLSSDDEGSCKGH